MDGYEWATTLTNEPSEFANDIPPDHSRFRQARDEVSTVLFSKIQRYGAEYFFGSNIDINKLILVSALNDAMKMVKHPVSYQIRIGKDEFPAFTLSANVLVHYEDEVGEISWVFTIKLVPGVTPIFHRERIEINQPKLVPGWRRAETRRD